MKTLGMGQMHYYAELGLLTLKQASFSLPLNAFFSKNDVRCAKTRYFALKTSFMHTIGFNAMKALGIVQMH